jgi:hypothetical protein
VSHAGKLIVDITTLAFIALHVTKWINGGVGPGSEKSNMVDNNSDTAAMQRVVKVLESVQEELGNKYHISTAFKDDDRWSRWLPCCICVRCMLP